MIGNAWPGSPNAPNSSRSRRESGGKLCQEAELIDPRGGRPGEWRDSERADPGRPVDVEALTAVVGAALLCFSEMESVPFAIGLGILGYAAIVLFYTSLSLWRLRHQME